jgi:hypothetical protein
VGPLTAGPASVEVVCKSCFVICISLTTVTFESNSKLHRIEESAFQQSGVTELFLPNSIHFLSGSAFAGASLNSISFWPGQCEFQVSEMVIEDIADRSLIRYFGRSTVVVIKSRIEIVSESCFSNCTSLTTVTFESNSKLRRIESFPFRVSGLTTIEIPASVEVMCKYCFDKYKSLTIVTFESNSKLHQIEESAFAESGLKIIEIPVSVEAVCKSYFSKCTSLATVAFESNSKLQRIDESAF